MTLILLGICTYTDIRERVIMLVPVIIYVFISAMIRVFYICEWFGMWEMILRFVPGGILLIIYFAEKNKIGMGDVLLVFAIGYSLGAVYNFYIICVAFFLGGIWGGMLLFCGKRNKEVAFAPFLFMSCAAIAFFIR